MQGTRTAAALTIAVLAIARSAARAADDDTRLASAIKEAQMSVSSFRETVTGLPNASTTIVFVKPDRAHLEMSFGPLKTETVVIGSTGYVRMNDGPWLVSTMQNQENFAKQYLASFQNQTTFTFLPDRQEGGITYGTLSTTIGASTLLPPSGAMAENTASTPITMQCTYEKATYLMHVCTMQQPGSQIPITITYSAWNDPQNVVTVPPDAPVAK